MRTVKKLTVTLIAIAIISAFFIIPAISISPAVIQIEPRSTGDPLKALPGEPLQKISGFHSTTAALTPSLVEEDPSGEPATHDTQPAKDSDKRVPVMVDGKKTLYLKLLTRPFSKIYSEPNLENIKFEKVDTFRIYYAYSTPGQTPGFYEVGLDDRGATIGYMKVDDVIEWKQYLTLRFTNKEEHRTLFFRSLSDIETLMHSQNITNQVAEIRRKIGEIGSLSVQPDDFPVTAVEPPEYVNIFLKPYLLPILDFKQVRFKKKMTRILKVASTVKDERKPDPGHKSAQIEGNYKLANSADVIQAFKADVVFVIDTTISMQPFIEGTRQAVQHVAQSISDASGNISFGLVGYRDDPSKVPGLEYRTKIYCDLEEGTNIDTFLSKVGQVREASVPSIGFDEDVWAGIYTAMKDRTNLKRRDDASLFIIQIGDAGAHDYVGETDFNALSIGQMAEDEYGKDNSKVWIFSWHLKTPAAKNANNVEKAQAQFRTMVSKLPGVTFYRSIGNGSPEEFARQANSLVKSIIDALATTGQGKLPELVSASKSEKTTAEKEIDMAVKAAIRAAVLERIGTRRTANGSVSAPRDIQAWTLDRNLDDPRTKPMEVMLLISRNDLSTLRNALKNLMRAGRSGVVTSEDFFDQLKSVMTSAMREPNMMNKGVEPGNLTLGKAGILPEFIEGLPYKTKVVNLSIERYANQPAGWQREFLNELKSKIAQYEAYYKNNDIWIELNEGDKPGDHVTFLAIDRLP
jgi:hypothetical protein